MSNLSVLLYGAVNYGKEVIMAKRREIPSSWEEWKAQHPRWKYFGTIEWTLERLLYRMHDLAIFEVLELLGRLSVVIAVIFWFSEVGERAKQKHYRAWELINSARGSSADGGRRDALQDLNEDDVSLSGSPLAHAYLYGVQLAEADLSMSDLAGADLSKANLSNANLFQSDLAEAKLADANLSKANLFGTKLTGAYLKNANLTDTDLNRVDLSEASLIVADLSQASLEEANLRGAFLVHTKLLKANLHKANLAGAFLLNADLSGANLTEADLHGAILSGANLTGANLTGANLSDATFTSIPKLEGTSPRWGKFSVYHAQSTYFCDTTLPDGTKNNADCGKTK